MRKTGNQIISLDGKWTLKYSDSTSGDSGEIEALVPGNVELDLMRAGLLPEDLFRGENILLAEKYETYDWSFIKRFDCPEAENKRFRLVFGGVDCVAEYFLNGRQIGSSDNMLVEHEFEAAGLKRRDNELIVAIKSTVKEIDCREFSARMLAGNWGSQTAEAGVLRRAAHTYGWDIMPRAVSAGIWRSVYLEEIAEYEFGQFFIATEKADETKARLFACYELSSSAIFRACGGYTIAVSGVCGDSGFYCEAPVTFKAGSFYFDVADPRLWQPSGFGKPELYEIKAELKRGGKVVCSCRDRIGIRTAELLRSDTTLENGGKFVFRVNGREIFARGTNWVPLSPYHSLDAGRLPEALKLLKESGCNFVRCWGGNVYESDAFYDFLDENGILCWQDFSFACTAYPYDDYYARQVADEAKKVIVRLRSHPSLILWAGDNDIDSMYAGYGINPESNVISRRILPAAVVEHDRFRAYLPSSPFVSTAAFSERPSDVTPERHLWGERNFFKSDFYAKSAAVFVSEIGYHGCVDKSSALRFLNETALDDRRSGEWILHSTDRFGSDFRVRLMEKQIAFMFGAVPDDFDSFSAASQLAQAEAYKFFIENARRRKPEKSGLIWWNLVDGWPQFADSAADYYYVKKPAFYNIARSQQPFVLLIAENESGLYELFAVNDTAERVSAQYSVSDGDTEEILLKGSVSVNENGIKKVGPIDGLYSSQRLLMIKWEGGFSGFNHFITGNPIFDINKFKRWYARINSADKTK